VRARCYVKAQMGSMVMLELAIHSCYQSPPCATTQFRYRNGPFSE
jgi:hypothetical protein